jgi:ABC-type phosphate transport system substrate-binding protein
MNRHIASLCLFGLAAFCVHAEVVVIVNPTAGLDNLSDEDISRIFLGKSKTFPNGATAVPVSLDEGAPSRDKFNDAVVKKNAAQLKAYWSQLVFTGKGTPPKDVGKDADVKALVAANPNMIGYIDKAVADGSVKIVFSVP